MRGPGRAARPGQQSRRRATGFVWVCIGMAVGILLAPAIVGVQLLPTSPGGLSTGPILIRSDANLRGTYRHALNGSQTRSTQALVRPITRRDEDMGWSSQRRHAHLSKLLQDAAVGVAEGEGEELVVGGGVGVQETEGGVGGGEMEVEGGVTTEEALQVDAGQRDTMRDEEALMAPTAAVGEGHGDSGQSGDGSAGGNDAEGEAVDSHNRSDRPLHDTKAVVGLSMSVDGQTDTGRAVGESTQQVNGGASGGRQGGDGGGWDHGGEGADASNGDSSAVALREAPQHREPSVDGAVEEDGVRDQPRAASSSPLSMSSSSSSAQPAAAVYQPTEPETDARAPAQRRQETAPLRTEVVLQVATQAEEARRRSRATGEQQAEGGEAGKDVKPAELCVDGIPPEARNEVTAEARRNSDEVARVRREQVKDAMKRVWSAYRKHAWGHDDMRPIALSSGDGRGSMGWTLVDSMDTLAIMGLSEEFTEAVDWVKNELNFDRATDVSVFETTIRELGGLLSAYELSGDQGVLDKAVTLGDALLCAFDTPSGIARVDANLVRKTSSIPGWLGSTVYLSEAASLQLEFSYLSAKTGDPKYAKAAMEIFNILSKQVPRDGLYPVEVNTENGHRVSSKVTFGAHGDSFYEYLLKVWLQGGRQERVWRDMFDRAMDGVLDHLLQTSDSGLKYVAERVPGNRLDAKMDHLVCFLPGTLALGAMTMPEYRTDALVRTERYMQAAKALTYTCYQMSARQATGLAPEIVRFASGRDMYISDDAQFYMLRPEAAEAMFYLHEVTKDPVYREWAWQLFTAIEKYCRTEEAYGTYPDVTDTNRSPRDNLESFFMAETLKYLYLIQDPDHKMDLNRYVFNTEAHPLGVFDAPPPGREGFADRHGGVGDETIDSDGRRAEKGDGGAARADKVRMRTEAALENVGADGLTTAAHTDANAPNSEGAVESVHETDNGEVEADVGGGRQGVAVDLL